MNKAARNISAWPVVFWKPAPSRQPLVRGSQPSLAVPVPTSHAPATPFWMCCPGHRVWNLGSCSLADRAVLLWWGWDPGKLSLELVPSFVAKMRRAKLWKFKDLLCAGEAPFFGEEWEGGVSGAGKGHVVIFCCFLLTLGTNCALLFAPREGGGILIESCPLRSPFLTSSAWGWSGYAYCLSKTCLESGMGAPISSWRC